MQSYRETLLSNSGISKRTIEQLCAIHNDSEILAFLMTWQPLFSQNPCKRSSTRQANHQDLNTENAENAKLEGEKINIAPVPLAGAQLKAALEIERYFLSKEWQEEQERLGIV